jgi:hypothetical protein
VQEICIYWMTNALEVADASFCVRKEVCHVTVYLLGGEDITELRGRLDSGGRIDHRPDDREILIGRPDFTDGGIAGVYSDAYPDGHFVSLCVGRHQTLFLEAAFLDLHTSQHGLSDVIVAHDGEVEDGQYRISDELVDDAVPFPDGGGTCIVKAIQHVNSPHLSNAFRKTSVTRKSANKTVAGMTICFFRLTFVNIVSQMVHRFGFI